MGSYQKQATPVIQWGTSRLSIHVNWNDPSNKRDAFTKQLNKWRCVGVSHANELFTKTYLPRVETYEGSAVLFLLHQGRFWRPTPPHEHSCWGLVVAKEGIIRFVLSHLEGEKEPEEEVIW